MVPLLIRNQQKIFCVGLNKTGTTSISKAFADLDFVVGDQRAAERMLPQYREGDFGAIIDYCRSAVVFQDFPFSFPETYKHLDKAFPGAKFILTVRDSPEQWYDSLIGFHSRVFGNGRLPTKEDLQNATYVWKGWAWDCSRILYGSDETTLYDRDILLKAYIDHNASVQEYFRGRAGDFIVINLSRKGSYQELMRFLQVESPHSDFPWENRTESTPLSHG